MIKKICYIVSNSRIKSSIVGAIQLVPPQHKTCFTQYLPSITQSLLPFPHLVQSIYQLGLCGSSIHIGIIDTNIGTQHQLCIRTLCLVLATKLS